MSESATSYKASAKAERSTDPAVPLAIIAAVSLVEVSVSTERQLNVRSITDLNIGRSSPGERRASVRNSVMSVAMSGSIIPTPLAMPTMEELPT